MMPGLKIPWAYKVFGRIQGIFCIYKPPGWDCMEAVNVIKDNLLIELNKLPNNIAEKRLLRLALRHNPETELSNLKLEDGIAAWRKEEIQRRQWTQNQLSSSQKFLVSGLQLSTTWKNQNNLSQGQLVAMDTDRGLQHTDITHAAAVQLAPQGTGPNLGLVPQETSLSQQNEHLPQRSARLELRDLATTRLVCGPHYVKQHLFLKLADKLDPFCSGVTVIGLGEKAHKKIHVMERNKHLRVYHLKGRFGMATDTYTDTGHVMERSTYHHVRPELLDKVCAAVQTQYQRQMFENAGVHPESQEAYDLACQGLLRPIQGESGMVIYNIKSIYFNPPEFTLEVQSISETSEEFLSLIHEIGLKLKSTAVCTAIRRIRYGHFSLEHALAGRKNWKTDKIAANIRMCEEFVKWKNLSLGPTLRVKEDGTKINQQADGNMDDGSLRNQSIEKYLAETK